MRPTRSVTTRDELGHILSIVRRVLGSWLLIGGILVLGTAIAVGVALVRQRVYRSETLMLYREGIRSSDLLGGEVGGDPARKLGMKLKEKVLSRTSLQQIIEELHLYPSIVEERGYVDAVDEMRAQISFRIRDGDTFGLSFEGTAPRQVQLVTARLAEALVKDNSSGRLAQATTTKEFLDEERGKSERTLRASETALAKFLGAHPEYAREAVIGAGAATVVEARVPERAAGNPALSALGQSARRIEKQLAIVPAVARHTREREPEMATPDPARLLAEAELKSARQDLENKKARFTDQHPDVLAAQLLVSALEARVRRVEALHRDNALAPLTPGFGDEEPVLPVAAAVSREELARSLAKIKSEMSSHRGNVTGDQPKASALAEANRHVALETESTLLNREVAEAREWQKQLADRQFRADITASSVAQGQNAEMEILDPAYLPTHPVKGGRTLVVIIGLLLSLAIALGAAAARALLDDRVHDRFDLDRLGLGEVLAVIARAPGVQGARHHV